MAAVSYGKIMITTDGEWVDSKEYEILTMVSYLGSTYITKATSPIGTLPTDTNYWQLLVQGAEFATSQSAGVVKPDGESILVDWTGGLSVGKLDNATIEFTESETEENIVSGETSSTIFGKILKSTNTFRDGLANKISTSKIVNTTGVTEAGFVPDALLVKTNAEAISTLTDNLANKFPVVEGDFTPGGNIIIAGKLDEGFMGFVQPSEMGKINGTDDYNGENLALAIGLASGTSFNSNVPLMKFHNKGKVLFIPLTGYRHSIPWDNIYNAGVAYETADEGFLPPAGRCGVNLAIDSADNSINCTNQYFLGDKTEATDYADSVGAVGDTLILKGWTNAANNATVTIVSITNTKIVVSGASLVTEQGGKTSRVYNNSKKINQGKTVTIGDKTYRVYLMRGAGDNPTDSINDADRGAAGADNEWNSLILPLHEHAKLGNWIYPQYAVDEDGKKITSDWGIGLTDENLRTHSEYGSGSYTWCQETIDTQTWKRVSRGYYGTSYSAHDYSWFAISNGCWRPVLESL